MENRVCRMCGRVGQWIQDAETSCWVCHCGHEIVIEDKLKKGEA